MIRDRILGVKESPFYRTWHFEIGIVVLFVGLCLVGFIAIQAAISTASSRSELSRHDREIARQARAGAQAHIALCAQRTATVEALNRNRLYLRLTPQQRETRLSLPPSLAHLAPAVINQSISAEMRTIRSYRGLRC